MDTLYFKRHLETVLKQCVKQTKVLIVIGPRQVGKTTLLKEILSKEADYTYVSLDDDDVKKQAISDPKFFLNQFKTPLMIDEIQKAPNLFEYIKFYVDKKDEYGQYILTGSEAFPIMQGVKDSLSTRCLIVDMQSLSYSEITNKTNFHFIPDKFKMIERKCDAITPYEIFTNIIKGSMPEVNKNPLPNIYFFYKTYCQTVFKDITDDIIKIKDLWKFLAFLKVLASLVGQEVNVSLLAQNASIDRKTAENWLNILLTLNIVFFLHPYSNNLLKRTTKLPKVYFFDTGLACYLMEYQNAEILWNSEYAGHIFECYAISEIYKGYINAAKHPSLYYIQTYEKKEIDLVIEGEDGVLYPIEIKKAVTPRDKHFSNIGILKPLNNKLGPMTLICCATDFTILKPNMFVFPIHWL